MAATLIKNGQIVNEGKILKADILIEEGLIKKIGTNLTKKDSPLPGSAKLIDVTGKYVFPGLIDDQVHFREPGLTHKADIYTESKSAVAGGITSYMEMPNTVPNTLTQKLLEDKYKLASEKSLANYSFYLGASNDNIDEILKTDPTSVCGVKVFLGSSTGNMLVHKKEALKAIFSKSPILVAVHCEDEEIIRLNSSIFRAEFGQALPIECHPLIRSEEACFKSSSNAVELANKYGTRLHILHISTAKEIELFGNSVPLAKKMITAEACIHHLWFDQSDYAKKGTLIKWNPAIKTAVDREAVLRGVLEDRIDVIATDHAPHTLEEKQQSYFQAPSGGPLLQHSLVAMLELYHQGKITLEKICDKMCHAPAVCFQLQNRGFLREGYWADLVVADIDSPWSVNRSNIISKCGWSPFEGQLFNSRVAHTFVNGHLVYTNPSGENDVGVFDETKMGRRLVFDRV